VGYRAENDIPIVEYWRSEGMSLKHKSPLAIGAMLRYETSADLKFGAGLDIGVGLDMRQEGIKGSYWRWTFSESTELRPWLRSNARLMFDLGSNMTPFVGVEASFAMGSNKVDAADYYQDFVNNTGNPFLGGPSFYEPASASFTRGHYPVWEGAFVAGVRFASRKP
jgi:hypothetical protein